MAVFLSDILPPTDNLGLMAGKPAIRIEYPMLSH
jgi:hypothetical protein